METFIKIEMDKYQSNEITKLEFIKNVAYKFLPQ